MSSELPIRNISKRSDRDITLFFDKYYSRPVSLTDNDLTTVVGFFESKGFDKSASLSVGTVLLNQAKTDKVDVYTLLQSLKGLEDLKLSAVIAEILNYNRKRTSAVGFKKDTRITKYEKRNIIEGTPEQVFINTNVQTNFSATGFTFDSDTITFDGE